MADISEIVPCLKEVGLNDTAVWVSRLKTQGVNSRESLKQAEGNEALYSIMIQFTEKKEEIDALAKLFHLPIIDSTLLDEEKKSLETNMESAGITSDLRTIDNWNKKPLQEIEQRLEQVLQIKRELPNNSIWVANYLSDPILQTFLLSVLKSMPPDNRECLLPKVQNIAKECELNQISKFIEAKNLLKILYDDDHENKKCQHEIQSIDDFEKLITKCLAERNDITHHLFEKNLTTELTIAMNKLSKLKDDKKYDHIFLYALISPFMTNTSPDNIAFRPITIDYLEKLKHQISKKSCEFKEYSTNDISLQSYIFVILIEQMSEREDRQKVAMLKTVAEMMRTAIPPLNVEISEKLEKYFCKSFSLADLKDIFSKDILSSLMTERWNLTEPRESDCNLMTDMGLDQYKTKKMTMQDALCIRPDVIQMSVGNSPMKSMTDLPLVLLHKVLSYDFKCRSNLMVEIANSTTSSTGGGSNSQEYYSASSQSNTNASSSSSDDSDEIHPLDCLLAVIICADDFLRQDLLARLAKCQLAVPFIFFDVFQKELVIPLWSLRTIFSDLHCSTSRLKKSVGIVNYPMPIISFIRIGAQQLNEKTKSRLLNLIISDDNHDRFFHRNCPGGHLKAKLVDGLVDMCWYVPKATDQKKYCDTAVFLNLHGDSRNLPDQTKFLGQISTICFIVINEDISSFENHNSALFKEMHSSSGGLNVIYAVKQENKEAIKKTFTNTNHISVYKLNEAQAKTKICECIKKKLKNTKSEYITIEDVCKRKPESVTIDEDKNMIKKANEYAQHIVSLILEHESISSDTKETMFPLQGEKLWRAWAVEDKELYRHTQVKTETVREYTLKKKMKKKQIRKEQLQCVKNLTPVMKTFFDYVQITENDVLMNYFLQYLKLKLDSLSRKETSQSHETYNKIQMELSNCKAQNKDSNNREKINCLNKKLSLLQNQIAMSSLGLEHFFREMGQLYEALIQPNEEQSCIHSLENESDGKYRPCAQQVAIEALNKDSHSHEAKESYEMSSLHDIPWQDQRRVPKLEKVHEALPFKNASFFPKFAAKLLIEGYPLEIMDGQTAHVPIEWVTAVLKEVVKILNNPNIYVFSVIGIQSSGKSTMLNTIFGLQFKVSPGKCTRGAFIQLLKLDEQIKAQTNCDFILVVDTEGLRALSMDPLKIQKMDNELATFVIGLANLTLINIKGEVPGDIDDILQTSVHAFLRMKMVKYHPSCHFVYQNATNNVKTEVERARFVKNLDSFTVNAAKEEGCDDQYNEFDQVIAFNDFTDVHYFPGLWNGDPPMGPVNPNYSQEAQSLKLQILHIPKNLSNSSQSQLQQENIKLSSFQLKIADLWTSLLKENFVFRFKNTLEIRAFNTLETRYSEWDLNFRLEMSKWEQEAENEIKTEPVKSLSEKVLQMKSELGLFISNELYLPTKLKMEEFFQEPQHEIMLQWQCEFEKKLLFLRTELENSAEELCDKISKRKTLTEELEQSRAESVKRIKVQVAKCIVEIKKEHQMLEKSVMEVSMDSQQLKNVTDMDLFSSVKLKGYVKKKIIEADKEAQIEKYKNSNNKYSEESIRAIFKDKILSVDQVHLILKEQKKSTQYLVKKFEKIWQDVLTTVPADKTKAESYIHYEVEKALKSSAASSPTIIAKLQDKDMLLQNKLEFHPQLNEHFNKTSTMKDIVQKGFLNLMGRSNGDICSIEASDIAEEVFKKVRQYIENVRQMDVGFKPVQSFELLNLTRKQINEEAQSKKSIKITQDYVHDMCVIVSGYAISEFTKIDKSFEERNNLMAYLENNVREPLFTKFKNQYQQTEAEEYIAEYLCAHLKRPIKEQVELKLGPKIADSMRASLPYFTHKKALKVKILTDLYLNQNFDKYMEYLKDVSCSIKSHTIEYTLAYCAAIIPNTNLTRLQNAGRDEVIELIQKIINIISENSSSSITEWIQKFSDDKCIRSELGATIVTETLLEDFSTSQEFNLDDFKTRMKHVIDKIKLSLLDHFCHITTKSINLKEKPYELLKKNLIGCTEQCPFCGEQCEQIEHDESHDHRAEIHRIDCLIGWRYSNSRKMALDTCPALIETDLTFRMPDGEYHPYKQYKTVHKRWLIVPDVTSGSSLYWKWFISKFKEKLAIEYAAEPPEVPPEWKSITWQEIKQDFIDTYHIDF